MVSEAWQAVFIGIGANLGEPAQQISAAVLGLKQLPQTRFTVQSSLYRTAPVGGPDQPDYFNAVARLETMLEPQALLSGLLEIERKLGRMRSIPNAPRRLDLDLLLYGGMTIATAALTVPHPRMHERRFVLEPLLEIAPDCIIPDLGPATDWYRRTLDQSVERVPA